MAHAALQPHVLHPPSPPPSAALLSPSPRRRLQALETFLDEASIDLDAMTEEQLQALTDILVRRLPWPSQPHMGTRRRPARLLAQCSLGRHVPPRLLRPGAESVPPRLHSPRHIPTCCLQTYHVVPSVAATSADLTNNQILETLNGVPITVSQGPASLRLLLPALVVGGCCVVHSCRLRAPVGMPNASAWAASKLVAGAA